MPPSRPIYDSGMESVGKGFWFALGFTPVFVVICFFSSIVIDHFETNGYFSIRWPLQSRVDAQFARALDRSFQSVAVAPAPRAAPAPAPVPVAVVANRQLSDAEKREQQCSLLVLKYSETQDPAVKKQMYAACPQE